MLLSALTHAVAGVRSNEALQRGTVEVCVPCRSPTTLRITARRPRPSLPALHGGGADLSALALVETPAPVSARPVVRSPAFSGIAGALLDFVSSIDLDGSVARARTLEPLDTIAGLEVARHLLALVRLVETIGAVQRPASAEALPVGPSEEESEFYAGPLSELVAIGLYRPSLDALCAGVKAPPRPPIDRTYLAKMLDEEVSRQFGHPLRPIVELVLNGVDASPLPGSVIDVRASTGFVEVVDSGDGMDLRMILSRLLLPFATDKRPGVDIGRFGVGFFSVLGIGLSDPGRFGLEVLTGDAASGWSIRVDASGFQASSLRIRVRRTAPRRGTHVRVFSSLIEPESVRAYLRDALHFFPPERAMIRVDGVPLNDGSLLSGGSLHEEAIAPGAVARFQLGGRGVSAGITSATYHAGVKVEACFAVNELVLIDFPAAVELTEGRDAFKPSQAHHDAVRAFYRRLIRYAEETSATPSVCQSIAEVAAQVSALMLRSVAWGEAAPELARHLLPKSFLVAADRAEPMLGFLGHGAQSRMFVPESFWAEREWHGYVRGEAELLEDELLVDPPTTLSAAARSRPDLPGLLLLAERCPRPETLLVALAMGKKRAPGTLPCLGTRRAVLVRADATCVRSPRGWTDLYALKTSFDRAAGVREADVERDLIVLSPLPPFAAETGGGSIE